ncbi:folylpolyglutamate synthase/dihydrofolate synthase family protein [Desulfobacterales bacterium HSG2]|nr:folylpolyglutamate synthase/dihydrofolate synthase family protein [Desulfobacterales bacterium HSG2]
MTIKNSYNACLETMYGLRRFGIILGLSTIRKILEGMGNPQDYFQCIHVAGTNGKGSIASALSSILHSAGYKVGLYTSPHLVRFNERICVNNRPVSDKDIVESYKAVKSVRYGDREPTFFEFATAMAFYEFGKQDVDWAVIETGMGGRMDATNIINPALSIISNISFEHQTYLGDTLVQIAGEKGGIIKDGVPVVTGVKQKSVISAIRKIAEKKSAPFYRLGERFRIRRGKNGTFTYYGIEDTWRKMRTGLIGGHQLENAAIVLAACEILNKNEIDLPLEHVRDGLKENRWPGRLEVASQSPFVLLDGAHNLAAARNLAEFLSNDLSDRKITLVLGILDDKPYVEMLQYLLPVCSRLIITSPKIGRALPVEELYVVAKDIIQDIKIIPDVGNAVKDVIETASPGDSVCIAGSLYVVGEAKEQLEKMDLT